MTSTIVYNFEEISKNKGRNGNKTWIVINNGVYDVTDFLDEHPGTPDVILEYAGKDATHAFNRIGHSSKAQALLEKYKIGELKKEDGKNNGEGTFGKGTSDDKIRRWWWMVFPCGCFE